MRRPFSTVNLSASGLPGGLRAPRLPSRDHDSSEVWPFFVTVAVPFALISTASCVESGWTQLYLPTIDDESLAANGVLKELVAKIVARYRDGGQSRVARAFVNDRGG
jgi:hypothetical protein